MSDAVVSGRRYSPSGAKTTTIRQASRRVTVLSEMLEAASRAANALGPSIRLVRGFVLGQQNPDGGFKDRAGKSDLYYTVFGLAALAALLSQPTSFSRQLRLLFASAKHAAFLPKVKKALAGTRTYIDHFGSPETLDFVHLCSFVRVFFARATVTGNEFPSEMRQTLFKHLEKHRTLDGGYHPIPGNPHGSAYGAFLALGAYQDLCAEPPAPARLVQSLRSLQTADGAWTNEHADRPVASGSTNPTAAAVLVLRHLRAEIPASSGDWLLRQAHPRGGFRATPAAPIPDLLSTASALHALTALGISYSHLKEPCLDFIDSLWTNSGGFHGNWADDALDCEYTFYGLMALGHLSACQ